MSQVYRLRFEELTGLSSRVPGAPAPVNAYTEASQFEDGASLFRNVYSSEVVRCAKKHATPMKYAYAYGAELGSGALVLINDRLAIQSGPTRLYLSQVSGYETTCSYAYQKGSGMKVSWIYRLTMGGKCLMTDMAEIDPARLVKLATDEAQRHHGEECYPVDASHRSWHLPGELINAECASSVVFVYASAARGVLDFLEAVPEATRSPLETEYSAVSPGYAARQQSHGAGPVLYSDEDDLVVTEETGPVLYSDEEPEITEELTAEQAYQRDRDAQLRKQGGAVCVDDDDDNVPHRHAAAPGGSIDLTLDDDDDDAPLERRSRGLFDSTSDDEPIVPKRPAKRGPKGSRGPAKRGSKKKQGPPILSRK